MVHDTKSQQEAEQQNAADQYNQKFPWRKRGEMGGGVMTVMNTESRMGYQSGARHAWSINLLRENRRIVGIEKVRKTGLTEGAGRRVMS